VRVLARKTVKVKAFVSEISGDTHMSRKQLITDGNNPLKRKIVEPRDIYKPPDQQDTINDSARPINAENTQTEQASKRATVVQYGTYLPRILVRQLKRYAFDNEIPATQVVQSAIRDYLAEHNGHPTK